MGAPGRATLEKGCWWHVIKHTRPARDATKLQNLWPFCLFVLSSVRMGVKGRGRRLLITKHGNETSQNSLRETSFARGWGWWGWNPLRSRQPNMFYNPFKSDTLRTCTLCSASQGIKTEQLTQQATPGGRGGCSWPSSSTKQSNTKQNKVSFPGWGVWVVETLLLPGELKHSIKTKNHYVKPCIFIFSLLSIERDSSFALCRSTLIEPKCPTPSFFWVSFVVSPGV